MKRIYPFNRPSRQTAEQAAAWVIRLERKLTPQEQDEYSSWLAAAENGAALARHRQLWQRLDRIAAWAPGPGAHPNPDLLAPPPARSRPWARLAAIAAVVLLSLLGPAVWRLARTSPAEPEAAITHQFLADGSTVELKRGTQIVVDYTPTERRVRLLSGEAHFTVRQSADRPFLVSTDQMSVRAVGTAFNVQKSAAQVAVLVTEGRVQLSHAPGAGEPETPAPTLLHARQQAVLSLATPRAPPRVTTLTADEIDRALTWQHTMLDWNETPLAEVVAEFNRWNAVQLQLADPSLADLRVSATFRSDNVSGFLGLLQEGFKIRAEHDGHAKIMLRR